MVLQQQAETTELLSLLCEKGSQGNMLRVKGKGEGIEVGGSFQLIISSTPENGYGL